MAGNTLGTLFRLTTWGEGHGPAIGVVVDGAPPGIPLAEPDIQHWLDRRRPGQSRYTTQRREPDEVKILSGVFEGQTTGTPIQLVIDNVDQRSRDYRNIADRFRPGHADYTYWKKYGIRDYRGGGRASARETASRVAAGPVARQILGGISSGQDIVARFAVKPTSSILKPMRTVDADGNEVEIETHGRHDPCVGIRGVPVGEAMMACVLADHLLRYRAIGGKV